MPHLRDRQGRARDMRLQPRAAVRRLITASCFPGQPQRRVQAPVCLQPTAPDARPTGSSWLQLSSSFTSLHLPKGMWKRNPSNGSAGPALSTFTCVRPAEICAPCMAHPFMPRYHASYHRPYGSIAVAPCVLMAREAQLPRLKLPRLPCALCLARSSRQTGAAKSPDSCK